MGPPPSVQQFSIIPTKEPKLVLWAEKALPALSSPPQARASRGLCPTRGPRGAGAPSLLHSFLPLYPGHAGAGHEGVLLYSSENKNDAQKGRK